MLTFIEKQLAFVKTLWRAINMWRSEPLSAWLRLQKVFAINFLCFKPVLQNQMGRVGPTKQQRAEPLISSICSRRWPHLKYELHLFMLFSLRMFESLLLSLKFQRCGKYHNIYVPRVTHLSFFLICSWVLVKRVSCEMYYSEVWLQNTQRIPPQRKQKNNRYWRVQIYIIIIKIISQETKKTDANWLIWEWFLRVSACQP